MHPISRQNTAQTAKNRGSFMQNLLLAFSVVAPLMVYMLVGAALRKANVVDASVLRGANSIIFYVTLPLMCYRAVASSDLAAMFDTPFLLYMALGIQIGRASCRERV